MIKKLILLSLCICFVFSSTCVCADDEYTQYAYLPCNDTTRETGIGLDVDTSVFTNGWSGPVGGKSDSERIYMLYAKENGNATGNKRDWIRYNAANGCDMEYVTAEFEVFMESTDIPLVAQFWPMNAGGVTVLEFKTNGAFAVGGEEVSWYKPNRWYNVAYTFSKSTKLIDVYLNGELVSTLETYKNHTTDVIFDDVRICPNYTFDGAKIPDFQIGKKFYFDNIRIYGSTSPATPEPPGLMSLTDDITVYEDENLICADDVSKLLCADVLAAVDSPEAEVKIYSDQSFVKLLDSDDEISQQCVLTVSNDRIIKYFEFSDYFVMKDFEFISDESKPEILGAKASFVSRKEPKNVTAVMVVRAEDGSAVKVLSSETVTVSELSEITINPTDCSGGRAYVYFINDWSQISAYYAEPQANQ